VADMNVAADYTDFADEKYKIEFERTIYSQSSATRSIKGVKRCFHAGYFLQRLFGKDLFALTGVSVLTDVSHPV
jgi:hypothetical protein